MNSSAASGILSPSTRLKDRQQKAALYSAAGVREYWLVDARDRTIDVLALRVGVYVPLPIDGELVRSEVLPGFAVDAAALFAALG